jgi:hypothetical protein
MERELRRLGVAKATDLEWTQFALVYARARWESLYAWLADRAVAAGDLDALAFLAEEVAESLLEEADRYERSGEGEHDMQLAAALRAEVGRGRPPAAEVN